MPDTNPQAITMPSPRVPEIVQLLVLSTRHLPEVVLKVIEKYALVTAYRTRHGALLHVPEDHDEADFVGVPHKPGTALLKVMTEAHRLGCPYVLFDCDGDTIASLPTYPW